MVFLCILAGLIGLLALLVSVPVSLNVEWDGGDPTVRIKYLFISYTVYPSQKERPQEGSVRAYVSGVLEELRKKRRERKNKNAQSSQQPREPKKSAWQSLREQHGFWGALGYMLRIVVQSAQLGAYIVRRSVVSRMKLHVTVGGDDAASIGAAQGQWCAVVYPAVSLVLCSVKRYRNCSVSIVPDFLSAENRYDIDIRMRVKPFHGILGAVKMLAYLARAEVSDQRAEYSLEALRKAAGDGDS